MRLLRLPLCLLALLALSLPLIHCGEVSRPLTQAVELRVRQIYDAGDWLRRVPVEVAVSLYARVKLESFVTELELPEPLRERLLARIRAEDFVDELVPFLLFVREMYQAPEGQSAETFDDHLRASFQPADAIPGIEHSMFQWKTPDKPEDEGASVPGMSPDLVRQLLGFYDVLYLQDPSEGDGLGEGLTCESRADQAALEEATEEAAPSVRGLLDSLSDQLGEQADMAAALRGILEDESRLDAATAALIRFIDQTVCRNYRFFAARAFRAQQLEGWMIRELEEPKGGALWEYLDRAQNRRRYGAVIVVDGLQGRLMEALARGESADPFVQAIAAEQIRAGGTAPRATSLASPGPQDTVFLEALTQNGFSHRHYLPFFKERLSDPQTHWLPVGISTTPTISVRNIPIALTGAAVAGPGGTGLPNFHFVDRTFTRNGEQRGRAYYFYGSDAVELVPLTERAGMQTLVSRLPQLGSMSCTAQYDEGAHFGIDALLNLGLGEKLRDFGERLCAAELERRSQTERELQGLRGRLMDLEADLAEGPSWFRFWTWFSDRQETALAKNLIRDLAQLEQRTLPELLVAYNPWPDHFAHFEGPFADEILSPSGELNRLDYWLGRWQKAYADAGVLDRTVFGLAGDHGLAPVFHLLNPEVEVFEALRKEGTNFEIVKISSDEGEGPKLTNPFDPPSMKGIDVVVASTAGGNYMLDLFADQGEGFERQPIASELRSLRPLASPDAEPIDLLQELSTRLADSLDYLVVRETQPTLEGGETRLMGHRDGRLATGWIRREGNRLHYRFEGADLLDTDRLSPYEDHTEEARENQAALQGRCLGAPLDEPESWCTTAEWRELSSYTTRPDAVVQLGHLYDSPLAGTVNLFPREGVGYNSVVPGRHAGESFHEKNAFVGVWGTPLQSRGTEPALRSAVNGAVPMAIYDFLSEGETAKGFGYIPLPEAWLRP